MPQLRTKNLQIPFNLNTMKANGIWPLQDTSAVVDKINLRLPQKSGYLTKDQLAVMDLISSNINDRAIYFAVTCKNDKLLGLNDYMQMEGLGLRLIPVKSQSIRELSIYGSGRVDTDKAYSNIVNQWKWGNFDTHETFIDESYAAEIQAMKIIMMRVSQQLFLDGENEKAAEVARKYFEGFPHFNFPYDDSVMPFIDVLADTGNKEEAKKHMEILSNETIQKLAFYESLDDDDLQSFSTDLRYVLRGASEIMNALDKLDDKEFADKVKADLNQFDLGPPRQR